VYNESVDEGNDAEQESATINPDKGPSTVSDDEIHEMAKKWYAEADEDERLRLSGTTTHQWIQDDSIASTHQLLTSSNSDLEAILKKDAIIENRERKLKVAEGLIVLDCHLGDLLLIRIIPQDHFLNCSFGRDFHAPTSPFRCTSTISSRKRDARKSAS